MSITAVRLTSSLSGVYVVELLPFLDIQAAHGKASEWWRDATTLGVVVLDGDREDARYERSINPHKLPPTWPLRKVADAEREQRASSDVFADLMGESAPLASEYPAIPVPIVAQSVGCVCCGGPLSADYGEGRDRTPSARLEARRCPRCGRPWPIPGAKHSDIQRRYLSTCPPGAVVIDTRGEKC